MTNTVKIPRSFLALGVCLPLAVLLGYVLAQPMESGTLAVIVLIFSVLATPLLMKWYHPLLILSWNACITPFFLPGQFNLWVLMATVGFFFAILNRSVNPDRKLIYISQIVNPLLFLTAVVVVTMFFRGGIGVHSLGGSQYGGSRYVYIFAAIAGYFALTSRQIPASRAALFAALFFLPGLTALISNLAYALGPSFYFLFYLFPAGGALEQIMADYSNQETILRIGGLSAAVTAVYCYLLSRYSFRGILTFSNPIRLFVFIGILIGCLATGFRSALILLGLVLAVLFYLEGLHRTRWLPVVVGVGIAAALIVLPYAYKLPLTVQRTLSFLPANVDTFASETAQASTDWRVQIWKEVIPDIPRYLWLGKGFSIDPELLDANPNPLDPYAAAKAAGDYHNGPLSVLLPLGIFGVIGFVWFLIASIRILNRYRLFGDGDLRSINTFLLALFIAKTLSFFLIFGGFYGQLFEFTGIVGLAVSLNGAVPKAHEMPKPGMAMQPLHRIRERGMC